MIKLVVCEDNKAEMTYIKTLLSNDLKKQLDLDISFFDNPLLLSNDLKRIDQTDVFLLDILMPQYSGIELGRLIRLHNPKAVIIYLTTSKEYALDAYEISALRYLIKPVDKDSLLDALKTATYLVDRKKVRYQIQTRTELMTVNLADILWVEYRDHVLYYNIAGTIIKSKFYRTTFEEATKSLFEHQAFVLSHRSYLVNMAHVSKMVTDGFIMTNQTFIPISKNRRTLVRKQYLDYTLRGGY
jgi:DNA-binding LytR/AlgR family response regulator